MRSLGPLLLLAGVLASAPAACARLGETRAQCVQRYGRPIKTEADSMSFQAAGVLLIVDFADDKADGIIYRKMRSGIHGPGAFSDDEIDQLLQHNGGDRAWKLTGAASINREWQTEDGEMYAHYQTFDHFLIIATKAYLDRHQPPPAPKPGATPGS